MDLFKRTSNKNIGPGGWKCQCCGPKPKDRPKVRRRARRALKQFLKRKLDKE